MAESKHLDFESYIERKILIIKINGQISRTLDQKSSPKEFPDKCHSMWLEDVDGILYLRHQKSLHPNSEFYISYERNKAIKRKKSSFEMRLFHARPTAFMWDEHDRIRNNKRKLKKEKKKANNKASKERKSRVPHSKNQKICKGIYHFPISSLKLDGL